MCELYLIVSRLINSCGFIVFDNMSKNFRNKTLLSLFTLHFAPKPYSFIFYDTKIIKIAIQRNRPEYCASPAGASQTPSPI
jgi:hypothetical protein